MDVCANVSVSDASLSFQGKYEIVELSAFVGIEDFNILIFGTRWQH